MGLFKARLDNDGKVIKTIKRIPDYYIEDCRDCRHFDPPDMFEEIGHCKQSRHEKTWVRAIFGNDLPIPAWCPLEEAKD